jgi:hypothetical protein
MARRTPQHDVVRVERRAVVFQLIDVVAIDPLICAAIGRRALWIIAAAATHSD